MAGTAPILSPYNSVYSEHICIYEVVLSIELLMCILIRRSTYAYTYIHTFTCTHHKSSDTEGINKLISLPLKNY